MVSSIVSAVTSIGGAIAGGLGGIGLSAGVNVIATVFTAIDALTNKQENPVQKGAASPAYSFGKLQTQVSNLIPRPLIYGEVKVAGNKIWQTGENTSTIKLIVSLCDGEIDSVSDIKLNDYDISALSGCSYTAYTGNGTQNIDSRVPGATQADKAAKVGGLKYDAYLAITARASKKLSSSGFNVTCILKGRKIRVYTDSENYGIQYSNNPAWCILDFLTCYNGMGLSHNEIDLQSFINAASFCDALVDGQKRFTLNLVLDAKKSRLDWLNAMLLVCRGYLLYQEGKVSLKIDQSGSSVQSFSESNIIAGSEKFWTTPRENKYDIVKVQFVDPENEYSRVFAVAELENYGNEQPLVKTVEAFGINNFQQASRLAWFYLNEASTAYKFMSFSTTKEGLDRTVGDIIDISSSVMGYTEKEFRIISLTELHNGQIEIVCKEYNANLYGDTAGSVAPSIDIIDNSNTFSTAVTDVTLQGDANNDQTRILQQLIDNLSGETGGTLNVDASESGVYINAALNVKSNVRVNFKCPVFLGQYGQLRIYGGFDETPSDNLPQIRSDLTSGEYTIYCGEDDKSKAENYSEGDRIIIRGMSDANGEAVEYQEATVAYVDTENNNITIEEPLEYSFKASYPSGDYEENFGAVDRSYITFLTFSSFASDGERGDTTIIVNDSSGFSNGDYIFLGDNKVPGDVAGDSANTFRHEVNKIINISGNAISLENAMSHNYETAKDAYIIKINPVQNAGIKGARVNYKAEPAAFTINAFTIAYAKDCYIKDCQVENNGNYTSKGHGFRIDRSINCSVENCSVLAPENVDASEGYGFTIYRANHNSISNCRAYGCRHSFLLFRGSCNNRFSNVFSINARISDIDFHGGDESFNTIDGFTIVGGNQKYGSNLSAIKFGNEYHVTGCYNNIVRNGTVSNYKGFGIDIVPISQNNLVENVTFKNTEQFIRCVDLSRDGTLSAPDNIIKNCIIDNVTEDLGNIDSTVNGGSSQIVDNLTIVNCLFKNTGAYFKTFKNTVNCKILNNTFIDGAENSSDPWFIDADNSDNLLIQGNFIQKGNRFVKIKDCSGFICKNNRLADFYDTVVLDDVSGNNSFIFKNNDFEGFNETCETSNEGSDNGINIKNNHIYSEILTSEKVTQDGLNISEVIHFDGSTPQISEGKEILSCVYRPKNNKARIKLECIVPAVYTDTSTNAVLSLFKNNNCIGATGIRLPHTGSSSGHFIQLTKVIDIANINAFCLSMRLGTKYSGPVLTVGDRFNEFGLPYIIITETGLSEITDFLYIEDLTGCLVSENFEYINKE